MGLFFINLGEKNVKNILKNINGNIDIMKQYKNYDLCDFIKVDLEDLRFIINNKSKLYEIKNIKNIETTKEILYSNIQHYLNLLESTENIYIINHLIKNINILKKIIKKDKKEEMKLFNIGRKDRIKVSKMRMEELDIEGGIHFIFQENLRPFYHIIHHLEYNDNINKGWKLIGKFERRSLALEEWHRLNKNKI